MNVARELVPSARRSLIAVLVALFVMVVLVIALFSRGDRGEPVGSSHAVPEVRPRTVSAPPAFGDDELATIAVFQGTSPSVAFIVNRAIRRDFFSLNPIEVPQGSGFGVVWDKAGHVITNFHVVYGADAIMVVLGENKEYDARVVGVDPDHDLAVLRVQAPKDTLVPPPIGSAYDLQVGQKVLAIGNPFGLDHTLTTGIVSAIGRTIKSMTGRTIEGVIQTDAAINPGNSGGPLLDSAGRLIGINTQIYSSSGAFAGIGFAVPVDMVNRIVPQLITHGKVMQGRHRCLDGLRRDSRPVGCARSRHPAGDVRWTSGSRRAQGTSFGEWQAHLVGRCREIDRWRSGADSRRPADHP
jgi:S1-C subfamily serine protease